MDIFLLSYSHQYFIELGRNYIRPVIFATSVILLLSGSPAPVGAGLVGYRLVPGN